MTDTWESLEAQEYAAKIQATVAAGIRDSMLNSARSLQAQDHILGVSDVGGCREYVRRMIVQEPFTDEQVTVLPAWVGTWVGTGLEAVMSKADPGVITQPEVKIRMPSGLRLVGHPDTVGADYVMDGKTVNGLGVVRRAGPSDQHWYQVTLYALGLIQAGILPEACWVVLVYLDRSGAEEEPVVFAEQFNWARVAQADEWLADVIYAVRNGEEASKDKPRDWCWACCPYATACRGMDTDVEGLIEDPWAVEAVALHEETKAKIKQLKAEQEAAKDVLRHVSGSTGTHLIRHTAVPSSTYEVKRAGYVKLDIKPIKRK